MNANANIEIVPLTPDKKEDYLYFFDELAFADHPDWSWCYCLETRWNCTRSASLKK